MQGIVPNSEGFVGDFEGEDTFEEADTGLGTEQGTSGGRVVVAGGGEEQRHAFGKVGSTDAAEFVEKRLQASELFGAGRAQAAHGDILQRGLHALDGGHYFFAVGV